ncbi:RNA polymerase sigma factor [Eremococcus coleocola]|uniref:RNA polymerase sigma factor n=1 Tax=Eremococcus coleocola TaxID=88132 RepID=UPI00041815CD|nr:sigma-70 family RNA polymerase sigma factor [Eremococcus coleocola]
MKIVLKSEPVNMLNRCDMTVFEIDDSELAIMVDADFELQQKELECPEEAKKRSPQEILDERFSKPDVNNFRRHKDNTSSNSYKDSGGAYKELEHSSMAGLNYHKRPPKDKKKGPMRSDRYKDVKRRAGRQPEYYSDTLAEELELSDVLNEALETLDENQRELIEKVFFEGVSQADIAREEGVSKTAIHNRLKRIYEKLKKEFLKRGLTSPFLGD